MNWKQKTTQFESMTLSQLCYFAILRIFYLVEVASKRLILDNIKVLHTIGGDDTNTQAAVLSKYIKDEHSGSVIVIGMPKTIDNDVIPIAQTFGADTAARQG